MENMDASSLILYSNEKPRQSCNPFSCIINMAFGNTFRSWSFFERADIKMKKVMKLIAVFIISVL
jgi:hypothetical protein